MLLKQTHQTKPNRKRETYLRWGDNNEFMEKFVFFKSEAKHVFQGKIWLILYLNISTFHITSLKNNEL